MITIFITYSAKFMIKLYIWVSLKNMIYPRPTIEKEPGTNTLFFVIDALKCNFKTTLKYKIYPWTP